MGYHYKAYGINLDSEVILPELAIADGRPDARVVIDRIPAFWNPADRSLLEYRIEEDTILFSLKGKASFSIQGGKIVVIDPEDSASDDVVRYYLLHSGMCCLMYQLGMLVLHGSVIETPAGAVVFSGPSGIGKSTLAGVFNKRGYRILSDDVCAVSQQCGFPAVRPSFAQIKLGADAVTWLNYPVEDAQALDPDGRKVCLAVQQGFRNRELRLFRLYEIRIAEQREFRLKTVARVDKLLTIMRNLYRLQVLNDSRFLAALSASAAQVAKVTEIKQVLRPVTNGWASIEAFADFLEKDFYQ